MATRRISEVKVKIKIVRWKVADSRALRKKRKRVQSGSLLGLAYYGSRIYYYPAVALGIRSFSSEVLMRGCLKSRDGSSLTQSRA